MTSTKHKILLVEDDPVLGKSLMVFLEIESFLVLWCKNLKTTLQAIQEQSFDLAILDIGLPDGSGLSALKKIREKQDPTPVLFLTAQTDEESVVAGLGSGANDYMKKPFSNRELLARVKNLIEDPRFKSGSEEILFHGLKILTQQRRVLFESKEVPLNRREYDLLFQFVRASGNVLSRETIIACLGSDIEIFDRTIDSHISHLRNKLKKCGATQIQISSVYGIGYRLDFI